MCDLDISEKRKPQDGKIKFKKFGPLDIELRVATIPTAGGVEDVVMRILAAGEPIPLDKLGLSRRTTRERLQETRSSKPYGLFFVCGPTGSGKTTTLHSVLGFLNTPDTKIWTAEDPVEITQKGLRQVQVNRKAGLDFAIVMRAFLRADPDIIMVGEMRDKETVSMGIEASLTGHLVFSTLHTNSRARIDHAPARHGHGPVQLRRRAAGHPRAAPGQAAVQLQGSATSPTDEEIERFIAEYAQELLPHRRLEGRRRRPSARSCCDALGQGATATSRASSSSTRAEGCDKCSRTGYKGRVGLHELLIGTDRDQEADPGARPRRRDVRDRRSRTACAR